MRGDIHPVDELLRTVAGDPTATSDDVLAGRRMLMAAMRAEEQRSTAPLRGVLQTGARPRRLMALVGAAALVVALVATGTVLNLDSADALDELALVAESAEVPAPAEGGYLYSRTVETSLWVLEGVEIGLPTNAPVAYLLPTVRERWQGSDGVREDVTTTRPRFFDATHEAAYYASGMAQRDRIGETVQGSFGESPSLLDERAWPTDPDALLVALQSTASNQGGDVPASAAVVDTAGDLLREPEIDPALRAGVIAAMGDLGVGEVQRGRNGNVTYRLDYTDDLGVGYRHQFDFDATANLIRDSLALLDGDAELGIPAGTRISDIQIHPVRSVTTLGTS